MVLLYKELYIRLISNKRRAALYLKGLKVSTLLAKLGSLIYKISTRYKDFSRRDFITGLAQL